MMFWKRKLKRLLQKIPESVSANDIVTHVIRCLKQRKCYQGIFESFYLERTGKERNE